MDYRYERIQNHLEACLQQAGVFERAIDGSQLFDVTIAQRSNARWLVIAAGISDSEASDFFPDSHSRDRAVVPMTVSPSGHVNMLLVLRPCLSSEVMSPGKFVTEFSKDVGFVELRQGCFLRITDLENPVVQQIRWELDAVTGHQEPLEEWLQPWYTILGINPAHAPSHWHINSPPIEISRGKRKPNQIVVPPELRLATGLPNPLVLILSIANWLRSNH